MAPSSRTIVAALLATAAASPAGPFQTRTPSPEASAILEQIDKGIDPTRDPSNIKRHSIGGADDGEDNGHFWDDWFEKRQAGGDEGSDPGAGFDIERIKKFSGALLGGQMPSGTNNPTAVPSGAFLIEIPSASASADVGDIDEGEDEGQ